MRRAVLALAAVFLVAAGQRSLSSGGPILDGALLFAAGAIVFAFCLPPHRDPEPSAAIVVWRRGSLRLLLVPFGLAVVLNASAIVLFFHPATVDTGRGWPPFFASVLLLLAAAWLYDGPRLSRAFLREWWTANRRQVVAVMAITAAGLFVRFYRLQELPFGMWYDESDFALAAVKLIADGDYRPLTLPLTGHASVMPYIVAASFQLLGESTWATRVVTALAGVAAVPAMYLLGRLFLGVPASLFLAVIVAFSRWHITLSRVANLPIFPPVFAALALYCLVRALRGGSVFWYTLSGVCFAAGMWLYDGSRFTVIAAAVYLLVLLGFAVGRRRTVMAGIVVVSAVTLFAYSPIATLIVKEPQVALQRIQVTSVFRGKSSAESIEALKSNVGAHLLMFHYAGDKNGRHNIPGEPMLDPVVGVLAVLGLAAVARNLTGGGLLFTAMAFVPLLGGILTLEWEAPQSVRASGAVVGVCLLAALSVDHLVRGLGPWQGVVKRRMGIYALAAVAIACAVINYDGYFRRQAEDFAVWAAHSTPETLVALEMARYVDQYPLYVSPIFHNQPTLRFLAPEATKYTVFPVSNAPLVADPEGAVILLDDGREAAFDEARRYYPDATFRELAHPGTGRAVAYEIILSPDDVASVQGLEARYYLGNQSVGEPALARRERSLAIDWGALLLREAPVSATWDGTLRVPEYGTYVLGISSPGVARVLLNGEETLGGEQPLERSLVLAEGNYRLEAMATVERLEGTTELYWQETGGAREAVPARALYVSPVTANGLLGTYYRSPDWSGPPAFQRVDPGLAFHYHITPLSRPYSVEWQGRIYIPTTGAYRFGTQSIDFSWVYLDDGLVVDNSARSNQYIENEVTLAEGFHDIRVRFQDRSNYSHIDLYWTPPQGQKAIVPLGYLFPPGGPVPAEALPPAQAGGTESVLPGSLDAAERVAMSVARELRDTGGSAEALNRPRDIAVDDEGNIYVVDEGNRRVVVYDAGGDYLREMAGEEAGPREPVSVVVTPNKEILVLDAEQGLIFRYGMDGVPLGFFGGTDQGFYRPRGLAVGSNGDVYVADTGRQRVVSLGPDGAVKWQLGGGQGPNGLISQPSDVLVDDEGLIYVVDPEIERLRRFSPSAELVAEWVIGRSNTIDGPHLALGPDGAVFLTDPEGEAVLRLERDTGKASLLGGRDSGLLRRPVGVYVDGGERVYVADLERNSVIVLER